MEPTSEEINIFVVPHSRMKQLVEIYSKKLLCTDFGNYVAFESLLCSLKQTFREFKSHEQIENQFIMKKLKKKLKTLSIYNSAVCNCHSDNQLSDILDLVKDGYSCKSKSEVERINYGRKLQHELEEFTSNVFLPHMQEEEEVFQPMLMKYFAYEELKSLKEQVILEHTRWQLLNKDDEKFTWEQDDKTETSSEEESCKSENSFETLPPEVLTHIFTYLNPQELTRCSGVCQQWHQAAYHPILWRKLHPVRWAKGNWDSGDSVSELPSGKCKMKLDIGLTFDEDADIDESDIYDDDENISCQSALEQRHAARERFLIHSLVKDILPRVGHGVKRVFLSGSRGLTSSMLRTILNLCPNISHLEIPYTAITDSAFKGLKPGATSCLEYLDMSGCDGMSDIGAMRLTNSMTADDRSNHSSHLREKPCLKVAPLKYLSLSGCYLITDKSMRNLLGMSLLRLLEYLDVSGCWMMTGQTLKLVAAEATRLQPQNIFYCDHIDDGPFPKDSNGCQNLECEIRACCCAKG